MLPNRFPDGGAAPEYNAADASLWFVVAVHELIDRRHLRLPRPQRLRAACLAIVEGYAAGTRFGIRMDPADGLLAAGAPGRAADLDGRKIGDGVPVTPRIGKPVEVQALWVNALEIAGRMAGRRALPARCLARAGERAGR